MLVIATISGILLPPINSRFRKDQLQQNRTLLGIRVFCIDFISIGRVLSINTISACRQSADQRRREISLSKKIIINIGETGSFNIY